MSAERTPELAGVHVADDRDVEPLLRRAAADVSALTLRLGAATRRADAAEAQAGAAGSPTTVTLEDEEAELRRQLQEEQAEHRHQLDAELARTKAEASDLIDAARTFAIEVVRAASRELDVAVATFDERSTPLPIETPLLPIEAPVVAVVRVETPPPVEAPVEVEVEAALRSTPRSRSRWRRRSRSSLEAAGRAPVEIEAPVELEAPLPIEVVAPVEVEQSGPSSVRRALHHEALPPLLTVAIVLIVLSLLVALVR